MRHCLIYKVHAPCDFNPRTPCGVRLLISTHFTATLDFNPRTPCGVRRCDFVCCSVHFYFNPRTPCGVRQIGGRKGDLLEIFQSTHPLRGATIGNLTGAAFGSFQSTHPLRGATGLQGAPMCIDMDFNPRTPCGVRPGLPARAIPGASISIHAPLAGCDLGHGRSGVVRCHISIHAPLAGCDVTAPGMCSSSRDFNPRTPCGVRRPHTRSHAGWTQNFNPRTPCGVRP